MKFNAKTAEYTLGALIVGGALCIMAPGLMGYLASLGRLGIMIVVALVIAIGAALILARINTNNRKSTQRSKESGE